MHVPKEQMPDPPGGFEDLTKPLAIAEFHPIKRGEADLKRRMMHEDINRAIASLCQALGQPRLAALALQARVLSLANAVQEKKYVAVCGQLPLCETVRVFGRRGEHLKEVVSAVMVPHHQMAGQFQVLEHLAQNFVRLPVAAVTQVAGDDTKIEAMGVRVDVCDAPLESSHWIQTV
jgi:hypothetical protein